MYYAFCLVDSGNQLVSRRLILTTQNYRLLPRLSVMVVSLLFLGIALEALFSLVFSKSTPLSLRTRWVNICLHSTTPRVKQLIGKQSAPRAGVLNSFLVYLATSASHLSHLLAPGSPWDLYQGRFFWTEYSTTTHE